MLASLGMVMMGTWLIVGQSQQMSNDIWLSRHGSLVTAVVHDVGVRQVLLGDATADYVVDGHQYSQPFDFTRGLESYYNGQQIAIRYDPKYPSIISPDQPVWKRNIAHELLILLGSSLDAVAVAVSVLVVFKGRRGQKKSSASRSGSERDSPASS